MDDATLDQFLTHLFILKPEQLQRSSEIKEAALLFAQIVLDNTKPGNDQTCALARIKEAVVAAGAALAFEEIP